MLPDVLNTSSRRSPGSLWSKIRRKLVFCNNRQVNRDKLYYKWVRNVRNIQAVAKTQLPSSQVSVVDLPVENPPVLQTALPVSIDTTIFSLDTKLFLATNFALSCVREAVSHFSQYNSLCLGTSSLILKQCLSEIVDNNLLIVWASASPGTEMYHNMSLSAQDFILEYNGADFITILDHDCDIRSNALKFFKFDNSNIIAVVVYSVLSIILLIIQFKT